GQDGGVDARVDVVADDGAELPAAGVDELAADEGADVGVVVADVGGDGAAAEVAGLADDAVAGVAEVGNGGAVHDDGVLELDGVADAAAVADGASGPEPAVGPDDGVLADEDGPVDDDAGADDGAFADGDDAGEVGGGADVAPDVQFQEIVEEVFVGVEQVPGVAGGEPVSLDADDAEVALVGEGLDGGGDFDLAALGGGGAA